MGTTTKVYSVFPACGKTWLYEHQEDYDLRILDSDSSQYNWVQINGVKERNPEFPNNYIKHIKENIGKYDHIFVSSHATVREALDREGIEFTVVYPQQRCMEEWIGRCFIREKMGESGCGAEAMYYNWDQWFLECFETGFDHSEIVLGSNEYLSKYICGE